MAIDNWFTFQHIFFEFNEYLFSPLISRGEFFLAVAVKSKLIKRVPAPREMDSYDEEDGRGRGKDGLKGGLHKNTKY